MSPVRTVPQARQVVVTGLGVISPYGCGCAAYWQGLSKGRCILGPLSLFPTEGFRANIAGEVEASAVHAMGAAYRARANRFLMAAAREAVADAALSATHLATATVSIGGAGGGMLEAEAWYWEHYAQRPEGRWRWALRSMLPTAQTETVARSLHIAGPRETPVLACSSSAAALATVADMIEAGVVDVGLAGGVDTLTRVSFMGFNALKLLDTRPCRPFARDRRGMSLGEGAAVLVLEARSHAEERGAQVQAVLLGCGLASDAYHPTTPQPDASGAVRAMQEALDRAQLSAADIDYVNAHGTGTIHNDRAEAVALERVFGAGQVLVSSTKSLIGHTMGAAGAMEAVATVLAMHGHILPPTANLHEADPAIPFDCIPNTPRPYALHCAMSNSFGFGGQNVSLILGHPAATE